MQDRDSSASQTKKAYTVPTLITHGTVQQLTQGGLKLPGGFSPGPKGPTGSNSPWTGW